MCEERTVSARPMQAVQLQLDTTDATMHFLLTIMHFQFENCIANIVMGLSQAFMDANMLTFLIQKMPNII